MGQFIAGDHTLAEYEALPGCIRQTYFDSENMARLSSSLLVLWLVVGLAAVQCADIEATDDNVDPVDDQIERAFLLVHKKIFEPDVVIGKNITVIVSIYNAGGRCVGLQQSALNLSSLRSSRRPASATLAVMAALFSRTCNRSRIWQ